ncbi:MAG: hypothetical protein K0S56_851 [Microvirga sp.]|nr:hypothetical protein [Microvirga sp.]
MFDESQRTQPQRGTSIKRAVALSNIIFEWLLFSTLSRLRRKDISNFISAGRLGRRDEILGVPTLRMAEGKLLENPHITVERVRAPLAAVMRSLPGISPGAVN